VKGNLTGAAENDARRRATTNACKRLAPGGLEIYLGMDDRVTVAALASLLDDTAFGRVDDLGIARRNPTGTGHKTIVAALFRHQRRYLTANHGIVQQALERAKMCVLLEKAAPHQGATSGASSCRRWAKDR
jgi:hypothetical protein